MGLLQFLLKLVIGGKDISGKQRLAFLLAILSTGAIYVVYLKTDPESILGNVFLGIALLVFLLSVGYTFAGEDYFDYRKSVARDKSWTNYLKSQDPRYNVTSRHMEFVGKKLAYEHILDEIKNMTETTETIELKHKIQGAIKAIKQ